MKDGQVEDWELTTLIHDAPVQKVHKQRHRSPGITPGKKHLCGASSKERRQYEHIEKSAQKSGRFGKRAKQVAARTVMKQHKRKRK